VAAPSGNYTGLNLETLPGYHATFEQLFAGEVTWKYQLELRADGEAVEANLHIEGPSRAQNPGDVRMVTAGGASRMLGPGTDNQCVQFPSDMDLGQAFVTPDHLIPPVVLAPALDPAGEESLLGLPTEHFTASQSGLGRWQEAQIGLWRAKEQGAVLGYDLLLTGADPLFGGGPGRLAGTFRVQAVGQQAIEPIQGCAPALPLPAGASRLVLLPGLISFDSAASPEAIAAFYQAELPGLGWQAESAPQAGGNALVLAFTRREETLTVNIENRRSGVEVELLFPESQ
jgi:hypothetical protein